MNCPPSASMQPSFVYSMLVLGASFLRLTTVEPKENLKVSLYTFDKGFLMNEEMSEFLNHNSEFGVNVGLS